MQRYVLCSESPFIGVRDSISKDVIVVNDEENRAIVVQLDKKMPICDETDLSSSRSPQRGVVVKSAAQVWYLG